MDTRSRNIKYSKATKVTAAILLWLMILVAIAGSVFFVHHEEIITSNKYYSTINFIIEYSRYIHNIVEFYARFDGKVDYNADPDILYRINLIKNRLSQTVNFLYYLKDNETGEVITNINDSDPIAFLQALPAYVGIKNNSIQHTNMLYYIPEILEMVSGSTYEVHTAVMEPVKEGDSFYDYYTLYLKIKRFTPFATAVLAISILLAILLFIYLASVTGRNRKGGEISVMFPDRIYTDIHTLLVLLLAILSATVTFISFGSSSAYHYAGLLVILTIDIFAGLSYLLSMIRQYKRGVLIKNSLVARIYYAIKSTISTFFSQNALKPSVLIFLLGYGLVNAFLFTIIIFALAGDSVVGTIITALITIMFNIVVATFLSKHLVSLSKLMAAANQISAGNLDYSVDSGSITPVFINFAKDLQHIRDGFKKAVDKAVRGERMKTALITNVSHDLKTPLTSIINYVGLLKKEKIDNEKAVSYIEVLDEKSSRLKQLIDDLIEASKASSGNMAVNYEKVNLFELINQACGEYGDNIENAGLDLRITTTDKATAVMADGKHMWRIVDNLISNILKYSLPGSRVYINMAKDANYGEIVFKNISKAPLDIPPDQLTERFIRGDESRTTEGSGLGLSIAQSLTELQKGSFAVEIDGDLFKVIVRMPLWKEKAS